MDKIYFLFYFLFYFLILFLILYLMRIRSMWGGVVLGCGIMRIRSILGRFEITFCFVFYNEQGPERGLRLLFGEV